MTPALLLLAAYLIGGIPFGYLIVKWKTGKDVRTEGSGNIGATNVLRTTGRAVGVLTLLLDIGKGALAPFLATLLLPNEPGWAPAAAVAVMLGHAFPVFLKFRGGKAVASFVGAFLYLTPAALGLVLLIFVAAVAVTRYISLGSVLGAALFPVLVWLVGNPALPLLGAAIFAGIFIVWRHSGNLARLRAGTENRFSFGGKRS
jgi:glycerol-3-phosphate acyltransferase PlsY